MHHPFVKACISLVLSCLFLLSPIYAQKGHGGKKSGKHAALPKKQEEDTLVKKDTTPEVKDTVKVTFGKNIVNLRTFNGYIIDDRGKWVSSPNRIPFTNPDFNNELYEKYILGSENIRQINIVAVKIDSTPYLAFIIEQDKGKYRYKNDSDFHFYTAADYFLIHPADFLDLWNDTMKMKHPYEVNLQSYYSGLVGYRDVKLRPKYMSMEINKDLRNRKYTDTSVKTYLQFGLMPVKNKKGKYMRFYYRLAYGRTGDPVAPFDFNVFKSRYYEADLNLFHKFSRPSDIKPDPVSRKENTRTQVKQPEYRPIQD